MIALMKKRKNVVGPQIGKLMEMPVTARLVLGECKMEIDEILRLGQGSMLVLDAEIKEDMKLYINNFVYTFSTKTYATRGLTIL